MKRLTYKDEFGRWTADLHYSKEVEHLRDVPIDRLAAYEDTGLEPEEIPTGLELANAYAAMLLLKRYQALGPVEELSALVKARDEGRVVVLPCKVGDVVYMRGYKCVRELTICSCSRLGYGANDSDRKFNIICFDDFGKTVFLTRAEAEAAIGGGVDG